MKSNGYQVEYTGMAGSLSTQPTVGAWGIDGNRNSFSDACGAATPHHTHQKEPIEETPIEHLASSTYTLKQDSQPPNSNFRLS